MNLNRLREETRREHEATEALMPLMSDGLSVEVYVSALRSMYSVVRAWDDWCATHAPLELRELLAGRQRSGLLESDLKHFGVEPACVAIRHSALAETVSELLGTMYVVEGSTLGGQYIAAHVERVLGLEPGVGDAYFRGYGSETGSRWNEFKAHLAALPETHAEAVVRGARLGFAMFQDALHNDADIGWDA